MMPSKKRLLWDHGFVLWIPIFVFVFLGVIFLDMALRRGARRTWAWGRTGGGAPLSRRSYGIVGLTFFAVAFTVARAPDPGWAAAAAIGVCFVGIIASGFADTRAAERNRAGSHASRFDAEP